MLNRSTAFLTFVFANQKVVSEVIRKQTIDKKHHFCWDMNLLFMCTLGLELAIKVYFFYLVFCSTYILYNLCGLDCISDYCDIAKKLRNCICIAIGLFYFLSIL